MNNKRRLGRSGLMVSPLMLGGNVFGWTIDEKESFNLLDSFAGEGFNFIDTADSYSHWVPGNSGGESETIIGNWMKERGNRNNMIVTTKVGGDMGNGKKGLKGKYIKEAAEASLKRLQTNHIDLYLSHHDEPEIPVEETMTALNDLVREGKVRFIGASNLSADRIRESNEFAQKNNLQSYIILQPLYNLYSREKFEEEYLPLVKDESLAVTPYYSLASGFLTGKYRSEDDLDKSIRGHGIKKYLDERGMEILKAMDKISAEKKAPLSEIAIAWLLHKKYITAALASATSEKQLNELVAATKLELSDDDMMMLDKSSEWQRETA